MDITKLKAVIQAVNPEIMELKFGCEVECIDNKLSNMYDLTGVGLVVSQEAAVFDGHLRYITKKEETHRSVKLDFIFHHPNWFKILGRPIRLADVLYTLSLKNPLWRKDSWDCPVSSYDVARIFIAWNLLDDNLDNQSDECKQFLNELLT
jgi:hypothetical protein